MLSVNGPVVLMGGTHEEMLNDTRCVVASFIKKCHEMGISEELIEKTMIRMIVEGFENIGYNKMFDLTKEIDK